MTFPASRLFEEIRDDVLIEMSINRSGNVRKHILAYVDRAIKSAHKRIFIKFEWARRKILFEKPLIAGQNEYEFPDETYPGNIEFIWAVHEDGQQIQMLDRNANPRSFDPINQREEGPPLQWWIENEKLVLGPAPSDVWPTLRIQGKARMQDFAKSGDRCQVDDELLIMRAAIRGLRFLEQHDEADRLDAEATLYEKDVAAHESSDQKIVLGQARHSYPSQRIDRLGIFRRNNATEDL